MRGFQAMTTGVRDARTIVPMRGAARTEGVQEVRDLPHATAMLP